MKRSLLITAFVLASFFSVSSLKAQAMLSVEFDSTSWISPLGQTFGDTIFYTFRVRNNSTVGFADSLHIIRRVGSGQADTLLVDTMAVIPPNDTLGYTVSDIISSARFGGGINIVVVWPASPSAITVDSASSEYNVIEVSVDDPIIDRYPLEIYPNPAAHTLSFRYDFPRSLVSEFQLMDQYGRLLRQVKGLPHSFDVSDLANGIYFLEARFRDGAKRRFKLMVTH